MKRPVESYDGVVVDVTFRIATTSDKVDDVRDLMEEALIKRNPLGGWSDSFLISDVISVQEADSDVFPLG